MVAIAVGVGALLVVQVRARRVARGAHVAEVLSPSNRLPDVHRSRGQVRVEVPHTVGLDHDVQPVGAAPVAPGLRFHDAAARRDDLGADG